MEINESYRIEYTGIIEKLLEKGYAKRCENDSKNINRWYLPHHSVYHPKKKAMRVVLDFSVRYQGYCLNDELLQGPDMTNSLTGVFFRFRQEKVPFMADIEAMYHQVKVPSEQQDQLRFLWWPKGDLNAEPEEYAMTLHAFGAISSPSCANFALRQSAIDTRNQLGEDAFNTLMNNFYVDDLLKSTPSEEEAVSLLASVHKMCHSGGFNLTKVVSNSPKVISSVPLDKRAASMREFQFLRTLPIERALGVIWCVENDTLGFRISLCDRPMTRRGVLATISSIFDPCMSIPSERT